jgi:hypothetical protein
MLPEANDAIDAWWTAFAGKAGEIDRYFRLGEEFNLPDWMREHLGAVHPDLMWEYGPALHETGHRLVITPEVRRDLRPLVKRMLAKAPCIRGWEFYEYRVPEEIAWAEAAAQGRAGGTLQGVTVTLQPGKHNRVDLTYLVPDDWSNALAGKVAFVATESLVGEEVLDRWIGVIESTSQPDAGLRPIALEALRDSVDQFIDNVRRRLPAEPWYGRDLNSMEWVGLKLEPETADDYEGLRDIFYCSTPALDVMQNVFSSTNFDSQRHSRCDETFCYLKIDGREGLGKSAHARGEIEDAVNEALRPLALGSAIGGGTGLRYSYIELALVDVEGAWRVLRNLFTQSRLPNQTWLLFHDADLKSEWYGLYHDTPAPYRAPREAE